MTPPIQTAIPSITDVFADHLIQKAKKVIEPPLSVKKAEKMTGASNDGFDIPTISEIAKKAVGAVVCRKEITELAELQKKIDQAKRQLRHMTDESEDEDFLNLGADKLDFDAELSNNGQEAAASTSFEPTKASDYEPLTVAKPSEPLSSPSPGKIHQKITFDEKQISHRERDLPKRQSVLERLGMRNETDAEKIDRTERGKNIISLSAHRRMEQAIYVPAHRRAAEHATTAPSSRRTEVEKARERSPIRRSSRIGDTRSRDEPRDLREKMRQRNRDMEVRSSRMRRESSRERRESSRDRHESSREKRDTRETSRNNDKPSISNRIGSKVIVAPPKAERSKAEEDDDDAPIDVPVNSVVKVKPRPLIPRSKQASKNLLLRAVAEAQKSTALVKPVREFASTERPTKELYTKSFRKKLRKDNIVVEIATDGSNNDIAEEMEGEEDVDDGDEEDEEYVPQIVQAVQAVQAVSLEDNPIEDDPFIYIPQSIHNNG